MRDMPVGPPKSSVIETEINEEISLYDPETDAVMVLNATASDIWRLSDGEHTFPQIAELLAKAYQVEAKDIEKDVEATVNQFMENGFLDGGLG